MLLSNIVISEENTRSDVFSLSSPLLIYTLSSFTSFTALL